jgi:hypothetical protein
MSLAWAWLADAGDAWDVILLLTLFFAWPLVVIVVGIVAMSWRGMLAVALIYATLFFVGMSWVTRGTGITLSQVAFNWWKAIEG